ncbi:hypothetical protein TNCV_4917891 [Trichonephila clavipes]|nr:hypothetical protein TNCV_4917891 [Trichonephila clavipes]
MEINSFTSEVHLWIIILNFLIKSRPGQAKSAAPAVEIVKICVCVKAKNLQDCVKASYPPFFTGGINIQKDGLGFDGVTDFCDVGKEGSVPQEIIQLITREPEQEARDYDHVGSLLLKRFKLTPEKFRQLFVTHQKSSDKTWRKFKPRSSNIL